MFPIAICFSVVLMASAMQAQDLPPLEAFFGDPMLSYVTLSPNGSKLAGLMTGEGHEIVAVMDAQKLKIEPLIRMDDRGDSVQALGWSGNDRILGVGGRRIWGPGVVSRRTVLFSVRPDGSGRKILRDRFNWMNQREDLIIDWRRDDSDTIVVNRWKQGVTDAVPISVRVATGRHGGALVRKRDVHGWSADPAGHIRVGYSINEYSNKWLYQLYARVGIDDEVEMLHEFEPFEENLGWFAGYHPNPRLIYVYADTAAGTTGLFEYDIKERARGKGVVALPDRDVCGIVRDQERKVLAALTIDGGPRFHYLDEEFASLHRGIEKALPGRINRVIGWSLDRQTLLIESSSSVEPPGYFLLRRGPGGGLKPLFSSRPKLVGARLARVKTVSFQSAGGTQIDGVVTRPASAPADAPLPAILVPSEGPGEPYPDFNCDWRHLEEYSPFAQFFASRGYVVLFVNTRGTAGRGREFKYGSHENWARAMIEDIEAGVKYLVSREQVDSARIGIYGENFAGYASLLSMAYRPKLFAAGGSFGGASDLGELRGEWDNYWNLDRLLDYNLGFPHDDPSLEEMSPARLASRFQAPVFLGHGDDDSLYRLAQSEEMQEALEEAGVTVELHHYPYETSRFYDERNRIDHFRELEAFFERYVKSAKPARPDAP